MSVVRRCADRRQEPAAMITRETCIRLATVVLAASAGFALVLVSAGRTPLTAQVALSGQDVAPVYEGWEQNKDGSFTLIFGYFNRNFGEEPDVPVGPNNRIDPGGPDQGQPTHFLPQRNRFLVRVRVPKDFGNKEVVWTLTTNGRTNTAYATLRPEYLIEDRVIMANTGGAGPSGGDPTQVGNKAPVLQVSGEKSRTVKVGEPIVLTAHVTDDGIPKAHGLPPKGNVAGAPMSATGLRLSWFVYRGAGTVTFDPPQIETWEDYREGANSPWAGSWEPPTPPADGVWVNKVTFTVPGTYTLRCEAHDGSLLTFDDVTFTVNR
jgi:hypothetical protein